MAQTPAQRQKAYRDRQKTGTPADPTGALRIAELTAQVSERDASLSAQGDALQAAQREIDRLQRILAQRATEHALLAPPLETQGRMPQRAAPPGPDRPIPRCPHCRGRLDGLEFR